jgi:CheY-like chemotaxis protein
MNRRLKLVVADDERDTREYLEEYLSHLGHDVRAAEDGRQLVEVCREFAPDVIVTDYAMPGLDGLTAAAEVNRDRRVPVVLISGRHDIDLPPQPGGGLVVSFLAKPVTEKELREAIEAVTIPR